MANLYSHFLKKLVEIYVTYICHSDLLVLGLRDKICYQEELSRGYIPRFSWEDIKLLF